MNRIYRKLLGATRRSLRRFARDEVGASAAFIVLTLASTVGVVGLGVESGLWHSERRQYQSAADAGAIAGAWSLATALTANNSASPTLDTTSTGSAWKEAVRNGATDSADNISVSQSSNTVTVIVTQPKDSLISNIAWPSGVIIKTQASASAVALGNPCILALGTTGTVVNIGGNATISANNCAISSNSTASDSVIVGGSASVGPMIETSGGLNYNGNPQTNLASTGVATMQDPFASLTIPTVPTAPSGACKDNKSSTGGPVAVGVVCKTAGQQNQPGPVSWSGHTWTLSSGTYIQGDLTLNNGAIVNVTGNLYVTGNVSIGTTSSLNITNGMLVITNGNLSVASQGTLTGSSATVILTGSPVAQTGSVDIQGAVTFTAPTSGTYKGIAFFQNPSAPASGNGNGLAQHVDNFGGGSSSTNITGAVYMPAQTVNWGGNTSTQCTLVVAKTVNLSGTSTMNTQNCNSLYGSGFLTTVYTVSLLQ